MFRFLCSHFKHRSFYCSPSFLLAAMVMNVRLVFILFGPIHGDHRCLLLSPAEDFSLLPCGFHSSSLCLLRVAQELVNDGLMLPVKSSCCLFLCGPQV